MQAQEGIGDAPDQSTESDRGLEHAQTQAVRIRRGDWPVHVRAAAQHEVAGPVTPFVVGESTVQHHGDLVAAVPVLDRMCAGPDLVQRHFPPRITEAQPRGAHAAPLRCQSS